MLEMAFLVFMAERLKVRKINQAVFSNQSCQKVKSREWFGTKLYSQFIQMIKWHPSHEWQRVPEDMGGR